MENARYPLPSREHHRMTLIQLCRIAYWGRGIILGSRTDQHVQIGAMTDRTNLLGQYICLFWGGMGAEFVFMYDNAHPHCANIVKECLESEDITHIK